MLVTSVARVICSTLSSSSSSECVCVCVCVRVRVCVCARARVCVCCFHLCCMAQWLIKHIASPFRHTLSDLERGNLNVSTSKLLLCISLILVGNLCKCVLVNLCKCIIGNLCKLISSQNRVF